MKKLLLIMAVFLMFGAANVLAIQWDPVSVDPNFPGAASAYWNDAANWDTGLVPTSADKTQFGGDEEAKCIIAADAESGQTVVGDGGTDPMKQITVLNGAVWKTYGDSTWTAAGYNRPGTINVERGGSMITEHRVGVGLVGSASPAVASELNVNGGFADINGNLQIGTDGSHLGIVSVNSGTLEVNGWEFRDSSGTWSFLDVSFGTLIVGNDVTDAIPGLIDSGALTGFGASDTLNYEFVGGETIITANDPLNRTPGMDAVVAASSSINLEWVNLGMADAWVVVSFGTDPENLTVMVDPNDAIAKNLTSTTVSALTFNEYVWRVDTYLVDPKTNTDPNYPIIGETMYFVASDDGVPDVTMDSVPTATWMNEPTPLQVTVKDDGKSDVTVTWTANDPNAVFTPAFTVIPAQASYAGEDEGIVVTTTMICAAGVGEITVTATAEDSNPLLLTDDASVGIYCPETACQATRRPLGMGLGGDYEADINVDCDHDLLDFAEIARLYMVNYTITEPEADNR